MSVIPPTASFLPFYLHFYSFPPAVLQVISKGLEDPLLHNNIILYFSISEPPARGMAGGTLMEAVSLMDTKR